MLNNTNSISLYIYFGELKNVLTWCENNCQSDWTFDPDGHTSEELFRVPDSHGASYIFSFHNAEDATLFILKWK